MGRIRIRGSLLRDIKAGFSYGNAAPIGSATATPPEPPSPPAGPGDIRAGSIGGSHFYQVRNVIQIPFDDSIDSTYFLECFFQMPTNVKKISSAQVWVQRKPFRQYSSATASGGTTVTSSSATHGHNLSNSTGPYSTGSDSSGSSAHTTDGQGVHTHLDGDGVTTTGVSVAHSHNVNSHSHGHSHTALWPDVTDVSGAHTHTTNTSHTHTLTPGIFESGPTGNVTLYLADNGSTYGAALGGPSTLLTAVDVTSQLTTASGDKRLKVTATGLMRVQVLLMLDLLVAVDPLSIGIP